MLTDFSPAELNGWISNFTNNTTAPVITSSAFISLEDLEAFIAKAREQEADSVRVHFIRFTLTDIPAIFAGCRWADFQGNLTQASIALVPAKGLTEKELILSADDVISNDKITTLMPGIPGKGTGMNPPGPTTAPKSAGGN